MFSNTILGYTAILAFCLISAFSRVLSGDVLQTENLFLFSFCIFGLGMIFFILVNLKNWPVLKPKVYANSKDVLWLNVTTLGSWLFLVYPLKYIEPAIVSTITLGLGPIVTFFLSYFIEPKKNHFLDGIIALVLFFCIGYLTYLSLFDPVSNLAVPLSKKLISLFSCVVVGVSVAINTMQTKKLAKKHMTSLDILMIRFFMLVLVAGIIAFFTYKNSSFPNIAEIVFNRKNLLASLTMVIVPLYFFQIGVRKLEPLTIAMIIPLMPVFTFFFELFDKRLHPIVAVFTVIVITLLVVVMGSLFRYKKEIKLKI